MDQYEILVLKMGRPSAVATGDRLVDLVARGGDVLTLYRQFCSELADYLSRRFTPREAAERYDMLESAVVYALAKEGLPRPSVGLRDKLFKELMGPAALPIIQEEEQRAAQLREEMGDLSPEEYIHGATDALRRLLGFGD